MYIPPEMDREEHGTFFDAFFLPRCSVWFFDGNWHVEESYGLMNEWTYESTLLYSGSWERAFAIASDVISKRRLFPVLFKGLNQVKGEW